MKGVFELKPSLPRYSEIWDISLVFNFIRRQPELAKMTLKALTCQLTFLLLILSGQRCQTIQLLSIDNFTMNDEHCIFYICESVKQTRPGTHIPPIEFLSYKHDKKLCVQHIKDYLARTKQKRQPTCKRLLISLQKPHGPVSTETIARWCKEFLNSAGVDTTKFKAHSTRAASTSHLATNNIDIQSMLRAVGWSNERTFQTYYHKEIKQTSFNFGSSVLNTINND